jgi:transcriptional regulator with XRE-family HTH domain
MATKIDASMSHDMVAELVIDEVEPASIADFAPDLAPDIGVRLKLIRERNGLSQRELAKRAGITNSNISMIEQGLVSPSVNSLAKVLSGIPMTLAQFFACDQVDVGQVVYPAAMLEADQVQLPNGVTIQYLATEKTQRKISMRRHRYVAGADTGSEPLRHKAEASGWVVSGQIELTAGMQVHELQEGDAFYLAAHQPYRIRNRKETAAVIVLSVLQN